MSNSVNLLGYSDYLKNTDIIIEDFANNLRQNKENNNFTTPSPLHYSLKPQAEIVARPASLYDHAGRATNIIRKQIKDGINETADKTIKSADALINSTINNSTRLIKDKNFRHETSSKATNDFIIGFKKRMNELKANPIRILSDPIAGAWNFYTKTITETTKETKDSAIAIYNEYKEAKNSEYVYAMTDFASVKTLELGTQAILLGAIGGKKIPKSSKPSTNGNIDLTKNNSAKTIKITKQTLFDIEYSIKLLKENIQKIEKNKTDLIKLKDNNPIKRDDNSIKILIKEPVSIDDRLNLLSKQLEAINFRTGESIKKIQKLKAPLTNRLIENPIENKDSKSLEKSVIKTDNETSNILQHALSSSNSTSNINHEIEALKKKFKQISNIKATKPNRSTNHKEKEAQNLIENLEHEIKNNFNSLNKIDDLKDDIDKEIKIFAETKNKISPWQDIDDNGKVIYLKKHPMGKILSQYDNLLEKLNDTSNAMRSAFKDDIANDIIKTRNRLESIIKKANKMPDAVEKNMSETLSTSKDILYRAIHNIQAIANKIDQRQHLNRMSEYEKYRQKLSMDNKLNVTKEIKTIYTTLENINKEINMLFTKLSK